MVGVRERVKFNQGQRACLIDTTVPRATVFGLLSITLVPWTRRMYLSTGYGTSIDASEIGGHYPLGFVDYWFE